VLNQKTDVSETCSVFIIRVCVKKSQYILVFISLSSCCFSLIGADFRIHYLNGLPSSFWQAGVPQGFVLAPVLYSLCINDTPQTPVVYLAFFANNTCISTTDRKEGYVLRKLRHDFISMESWCERWNIKIDEGKSQAIYSHRRGTVEVYLALKRRHIPFLNNVKYQGAIFC
jgi:hypothetical protein